MAIFNELQAGRLNRGLQKLTGIKGRASVRQLGTEILPVFSMPLGAEFRYLEGWNLFGIAFSQNAVAANNSAFRLRNPAANNVVAVITQLVLVNFGAAEQINVEGWVAQTADLATDVTSSVTRFDARLSASGSTSLRVSVQNTAPLAGFGNTPAFIGLNTEAEYPIIQDAHQELPLLPGDAMQCRATVVNTALAGYIWWRERFLEDAERF